MRRREKPTNKQEVGCSASLSRGLLMARTWVHYSLLKIPPERVCIKDRHRRITEFDKRFTDIAQLQSNYSGGLQAQVKSLRTTVDPMGRSLNELLNNLLIKVSHILKDPMGSMLSRKAGLIHLTRI